MKRRNYMRTIGVTGAAAVGLTGHAAAAEPCYYQVDFVAGAVEEQLGESENDFYGRQNRLIQYAHGEGNEITKRDTWINSLDSDTRACVTADPISVSDGTASVSFTVEEGCELQLSLAVYTMSESGFDFDTASEQELSDSATETFTGGTHELEAAIPCASDDTECVECPVDPEDITESDLVNISSVEPSSFPEVSVFTRVETDAGDAAELESDDFSLCEDGCLQEDISVSSSSSGGGTADIAFLLDDTGSMGDEIEGVLTNIEEFANELDAASIDARYSLITFKDSVELDQEFTSDVSVFQDALDDVSAIGGGDGREDNFDAIERATELSYREGAQRVIVDVTDNAAQVDDPDAAYNDETVTDLTMPEVESLLNGYTFIAVSPDLSEYYSESDAEVLADGDKQILANNVGGTWIDITNPDFSSVLEEISGIITSTYTLTYTAPTDGDSERQVVISVDEPAEGTLYQTTSYTVPE